MSVDVLVADAVVAHINSAPAGTYGTTFTAALDFDPDIDRHNLASLDVCVMPTSRSPILATRDKMQEVISVSVAVRKQVNPGSASAVKALRDLTEKIYDRLAMAQLSTYTAAHFESIAVEFPWEPFKEDRTFLAVINISYKVWR